MARPTITVAPTDGVTAKPDGLKLAAAESKFRYLAVVPSIALATPSEAGLLAEEAKIWSLGTSTFWGDAAPRNCSSAVCILFWLGPWQASTVQR